MRVLLASFAITSACSGSPKKQTALDNEGFNVPATCCCKTTPVTAEKEIVPVYSVEGRMECSTKNGDCVDDVQCNGIQTSPAIEDGVPPPAPIAPATESPPIP